MKARGFLTKAAKATHMKTAKALMPLAIVAATIATLSSGQFSANEIVAHSLQVQPASVVHVMSFHMIPR